MKRMTQITGLATTAALILGTALTPAFAQTLPGMDAPQGTQEQPQVSQNEARDGLLQVSQEAALSLHAIRGARLAIFDGQEVAATEMISAALTQMKTAQTQAEELNLQPENTTQPGAYVPFELSMFVDEDFQVTDGNEDDIARAQAEAGNGQEPRAVLTLASAGIDSTLTAALIPTDQAIEGLEQAMAAAKAEDWQEANMALKFIEESVVFEDWTAETMPMQNAANDLRPENRAAANRG